MTASLAGIRVLDLSRILAGPSATQLLGDLGADVVKIERPGEGDDTRRWGPPYIKDSKGQPTSESAYYLSANRNKRSITLDLRAPEGKEILRELLKTADVVVNNYRPGIMDKMGFGREALSQIKPDLVSCNVTGFGLDGPYADRPSFDFVAQAMSGFMSVNGAANAPPMRAAPPISDLIAGSYAAMGILASSAPDFAAPIGTYTPGAPSLRQAASMP